MTSKLESIASTSAASGEAALAIIDRRTGASYEIAVRSDSRRRCSA
jgi:hypothetical protein